MTWTKLGDEFADECARAGLSDAAFRTHVEALVWTMRRETGGFLDHRDIRKAIETTNAASAIAELLAVNFWEKVDYGYQVHHHMWCQVEPEVIGKRRDAERLRQQRKRKHANGIHDLCLPGRCPHVTA